jgi:uncharacterized integral membrane protein
MKIFLMCFGIYWLVCFFLLIIVCVFDWDKVEKKAGLVGKSYTNWQWSAFCIILCLFSLMVGPVLLVKAIQDLLGQND